MTLQKQILQNRKALSVDLMLPKKWPVFEVGQKRTMLQGGGYSGDLDCPVSPSPPSGDADL